MSGDIDDIKEHSLCFNCIGEGYLKEEVRKKGKRTKCNYCSKTGLCYDLFCLSDRIDEVFEEYYFRTAENPEGLDALLHFDSESDYEWSREGEPVVWAIMNLADMPEAAASDIQEILAEKHYDFDSAAMGVETSYSSDSYYAESSIDQVRWQEDWSEFERQLRTETRYFNKSAAKLLTEIFDGIDELKTREGQPLVMNAGPNTGLPALYRARVFQSKARLQEALERPERHLGPPTAIHATAGRMNARGIVVFYGANDPMVALSEVRPPVGSDVAIARFEITRPLRLLDLTALRSVRRLGSPFDPTHKARLEHAAFLKTLSHRLTKPVMPDDEPFEYLVTQAVADFLATEKKLDGIAFPSVQSGGNALNIVLFRRAADIEQVSLPPNTTVEASLVDRR